MTADPGSAVLYPLADVLPSSVHTGSVQRWTEPSGADMVTLLPPELGLVIGARGWNDLGERLQDCQTLAGLAQLQELAMTEPPEKKAALLQSRFTEVIRAAPKSLDRDALIELVQFRGSPKARDRRAAAALALGLESTDI